MDSETAKLKEQLKANCEMMQLFVETCEPLFAGLNLMSKSFIARGLNDANEKSKSNAGLIHDLTQKINSRDTDIQVLKDQVTKLRGEVLTIRAKTEGGEK